MSYVERNLLPNEQITYRAKLHWIIYALPAVVFLIAMILTVLPFTAMILAIKAHFSRKVQDEATALELPSGSGTERLALYDRSL